MLRNADFRAVDRILPELYSQDSLDSLAVFIMRSIPAIVGSDVTSYTEVNPGLGRSVGAMDSAASEAIFLEHKPAFERHVQEHPLIAHYFVNPDDGPRKISDFLSLNAWKRTHIYREFFTHFGLNRQMVVNLPSTNGTLTGIALNRESKDFSEHDRELLTLLSPHLRQAYINTAGHQLASIEANAARDALELVSQGVVSIGSDGYIVLINALASRAFEDFFPDYRTEDPSLPRELRDWLNETENINSTHSTKFIDRSPGRLKLTLSPSDQGDTRTLIIERYIRGSHPNTLSALGLSIREAEVLYWVAQGKQNAEIAIVLGISARTVEKHLQSIYRALKVDNRIQAAILAIQTLS